MVRHFHRSGRDPITSLDLGWATIFASRHRAWTCAVTTKCCSGSGVQTLCLALYAGEEGGVDERWMREARSTAFWLREEATPIATKLENPTRTTPSSLSHPLLSHSRCLSPRTCRNHASRPTPLGFARAPYHLPAEAPTPSSRHYASCELAERCSSHRS